VEGRRAADAEQPGGAVNDGGKSLDVAFDASTEFPVIAACTYLNHAALAPWPRRTQDAVTRFAAEDAPPFSAPRPPAFPPPVPR
jgi:hypothetical protein